MPIKGTTASHGSIPDTPSAPTASSGNASASVSFTAPNWRGKGTSSTYRVTSSPSGIQATGSSSPISVTGLANGTAYTFTVRVETPHGVSGLYSAASLSATPVAPPFFPFFPPSFPFFPPFFPFFPFFPSFCCCCGTSYSCAGPYQSNACGYEACMNFDSCGNFCGC